MTVTLSKPHPLPMQQGDGAAMIIPVQTKAMRPFFNLASICRAVAAALSEQTTLLGGNKVTADDIANTFNGSNLSAITERHLAAVMRGEHIGSEQTNYDVKLTDVSVVHWAKKLEQRNMVKSSNLGPSTTAGKNRYFDLPKFVQKINDCDSLIVYDLNSDPENIDIYEIPARLVFDLWKLNVIGTEVVINQKKQGYRNAMVTYKRFKALFPIEDYRFVVNADGHKMQNETAVDCYNKAQQRGFGKLQMCEEFYNFDAVDFDQFLDAA